MDIHWYLIPVPNLANSIGTFSLMYINQDDEGTFYIDMNSDVLSTFVSSPYEYEIPDEPSKGFISQDHAFTFIKDFIHNGEMRLEQKYSYNRYLFKVIKIHWFTKLLKSI